MCGADDDRGCVSDRYAQLIMLIRHQLALDDSGSFADGVGPDNLTFAKVWVRAKVRQAVRWGVLNGEDTAQGPLPTDTPRPA
jgi:hypothetical protein